MKFTKEILKKLELEGISWTDSGHGTLEYLAAYEHCSAVINVEGGFFGIIDECLDPSSNDGIICERVIEDGKSAEQVLRDVAEACGSIDQGIEDAMGSISAYGIYPA
jgi:hypothetical protein